MVNRASSCWQSLTLCTLGLGLAVTSGIFLVVWASDATPPTPDSASTSPPPPAASPTQPPQQAGGRRMEGMQHMRQACAADVKKFCAQVKPGGGRILECLEDHSKEVSDECYGLLEKRAERQKGGVQ